MWRDEIGMMEMLLSYIGGFNDFDSWSDWRPILVDILSCHEETRQQRMVSFSEARKEDSIREETSDPYKKGSLDSGFTTQGEQSFECEFYKEITEEESHGMTSLSRNLETINESETIGVTNNSQSWMPFIKDENNSGVKIGQTLQSQADICKIEVEDSTEDSGIMQTSRVEMDYAASYTGDEVEAHPSSISLNPSQSERGIGRMLATNEDSPDLCRTSSDGYSFTCGFCEKSFNEITQFQMHVKLHNRSCVCTVCHKALNSSANLRRHMRTHTGERPYSCTLCNKTYKDGTNLRRHMKNHTGERPYHCQYCEKTFKECSELRIHMTKHTNFYPQSNNVS